MKSKHVLIAFAILSAFALTACGGAAKTAAQPAATATAASAQPSLATGVSAMRQVLAETQKAITAGDAAKAQLEAKEIDEAWEKFEDDVKAKNKDLYGKIEEQLQLIQAATKATPMDSKAATDAGTKLGALLDDLLK